MVFEAEPDPANGGDPARRGAGIEFAAQRRNVAAALSAIAGIPSHYQDDTVVFLALRMSARQRAQRHVRAPVPRPVALPPTAKPAAAAPKAAPTPPSKG